MSGWKLPPTLQQSLERVPDEYGVALLIRHAHRPQFPEGQDGAHVALTEEGIRLAETLGRRLRGRLHQIYTSPLLRCRQTAESLVRGAAAACDPISESLLGDPGPFVEDATLAWPVFLAHTPLEVAQQQMAELEPLPGMRTPEEGVERLLRYLLNRWPPPGRITIHVTHDIVLALAAALLLGEPIEAQTWPDYLEGMLLWSQGSSLRVVWRGRQTEVLWPRAMDGDSAHTVLRRFGSHG